MTPLAFSSLYNKPRKQTTPEGLVELVLIVDSTLFATNQDISWQDVVYPVKTESINSSHFTLRLMFRILSLHCHVVFFFLKLVLVTGLSISFVYSFVENKIDKKQLYFVFRY